MDAKVDVPVTEKILKDSGLKIGDIDLFEVNEAFAAVVLRFMQAFKVSPDRVNVNGGAIAMGHPLGASGAIIIGTLLDEMERRDLTLGLATDIVESRYLRDFSTAEPEEKQQILKDLTTFLEQLLRQPQISLPVLDRDRQQGLGRPGA